MILMYCALMDIRRDYLTITIPCFINWVHSQVDWTKDEEEDSKTFFFLYGRMDIYTSGDGTSFGWRLYFFGGSTLIFYQSINHNNKTTHSFNHFRQQISFWFY